MNLRLTDFKCAVFDLDGTLLDSMPFWHTVSDNYLLEHGKKIQPGLWDDVKRLTLTETAEYYIKIYGIRDSVEKISEEIRLTTFEAYSKSLMPKKGARELLEKLNDLEIPCVLATATEKSCVEACFERLDFHKYFKRLFSCLELKTNKHEPLIFLKSAEVCGAKSEESLVFEDALHCIRTAKKARFNVCAVYDESSEEVTEPPESDWERILSISDYSVKSLKELL